MADNSDGAGDSSRKLWHLTLGDNDESGFSILAITETLLATAFSLFLVIFFQNWWHVWASAMIAPLLMLRSPESTKHAADRFNNWIRDNVVDEEIFLPILTIYPRAFAMSLKIRISSTLKFFSIGFRNIPRNYVSLIARTDMANGVPLVPNTKPFGSIVEIATKQNLGINTLKKGAFTAIISIFSLAAAAVLTSISNQDTAILLGIIFSVLFVCFGIYTMNIMFSYVFFFAAAWLRLSVKSTALIWLPIVFLASRMPRNRRETREAIQEEREGALPSLLRKIAWLALIFFLWRALIFPSSYDFWIQQDWTKILLIPILPLGTDPSILHLWHIASGLSALLTLICYFFLWDRSARRIARGYAIPNGVFVTYGTVYWLRGLLSLYTIACSIYFIGIGARLISVPELSWCLFPWLKGCS